MSPLPWSCSCALRLPSEPAQSGKCSAHSAVPGTKPTPRQPWLCSCSRARLSLSSTAAPSSLPSHCSVTKPKEIGSCNQDPPSKPCWASAPRVKPPPSTQAQPTSSTRGAAREREGAVSDPQVIGGSCQGHSQLETRLHWPRLCRAPRDESSLAGRSARAVPDSALAVWPGHSTWSSLDWLGMAGWLKCWPLAAGVCGNGE